LPPPLSAAAAKEKTAPVGDVVVNVKADGTVVINRRTLSSAELSELLKWLVQLDSKQRVIIRGDEAGAYKNIIGVLNICTEAGITNVAFATASKADVPVPSQQGVQQPDEKKSFDKLLQKTQVMAVMPLDKPKGDQADVRSVMSERVAILFEKPTRSYEVLGQVTSAGAKLSSNEANITMLQVQAAKLGADAVIIQDIGVQAASGLAIKYKKSGSD
jgi:hypothetical protein